MRSALRRVSLAWRHWNRFWFDAHGPTQVRLFRQAFGALLTAFYLVRGLDLEFFFGDAGVLPLEVMRATMPMQYRFSIFHHFSSNAAIWTGHAAFIAALVALTVGWRPRLAAAVALGLHLSFMHRNMATVFGIDLIATFYLAYLCFLDEYAQPGTVRGALSSAAFRFAQLQLCVIYAYSGLEKLKGSPWWNGEAIWDVLANPQLARWDFSFMANLPLAIVLATYATLAWEIYFPVLIWVRRLRTPLLLGGLLLHASIGLVISIPFFAAVMLLTYAFFLTERQAQALSRALGAPWRSLRGIATEGRPSRSRSPSPGAADESCRRAA